MYDVLPQPPDDMSIARADPSACQVMLTPPICTMGEDAHFTQYDVLATLGNGRHLMMGDDPRLPKMPARPRLADFFRHRFVPMVANHLLQSASLARKNGLDGRIVIACLLHDIAVAGLITSDHGYWGAQLIEPYVDEEISWAVRHHQALRYFPDESVGYSISRSVYPLLRRGLSATRLSAPRLRAGTTPQMVYYEQTYHGERSICLRPSHNGRHRRFRRRDWHTLQAAEGRSRV
jgi:HD domain